MMNLYAKPTEVVYPQYSGREIPYSYHALIFWYWYGESVPTSHKSCSSSEYRTREYRMQKTIVECSIHFNLIVVSTPRYLSISLFCSFFLSFLRYFFRSFFRSFFLSFSLSFFLSFFLAAFIRLTPLRQFVGCLID